MAGVLLAQFAGKISQLEQNVNGQEKSYLTFWQFAIAVE